MTAILGELRYALRLIRRNRTFAVAVVLSSALGVGATASIFSLIDALLLRPLSVPDTGRVVRLVSVTQTSAAGRFSYAEAADIQKGTRSFDGFATSRNASVGFAQRREDQPRATVGAVVNGEFFSTLRVPAALGRTFTADDDRVPGGHPVAMISHAMWQRDFAGRPDVVGRAVRLNSIDFTIVGVVAEWFTGVQPFLQPALYVPAAMVREATGAPLDVFTDRTARGGELFARLKPGVSIEQARADLRRLAVNLEQEYPASNKGRGAMVHTQVGYRMAGAPDLLAVSSLFSLIAAFVLAIACINVANLLLSTAPARMRETAVRLAMGASRARLLRQFLIESLVLSTAGAALGLGIAAVCAGLIGSIEIASDFPVRLETRVDVRVALFALGVGLASGLLAGLVPALRATRADLNTVLKATELRLARSRGWMRQALVVAQVAAALVMMILSGLFLESVRLAHRTHPGFRVDHVLTLGLDPRTAGYDLDKSHVFFGRLVARVRTLPGVSGAALGEHVPLGVASSASDISIPGSSLGPQAQTTSISRAIVGDRYFDVLGIPILEGRAFSERDTRDAPPVAIVNEAAAAKYWPNRSALGARVAIHSAPTVTAEIVGIARQSKTGEIDETPQPFLYLPLGQSRQTRMTLFVQTAGEPGAFVSAVRNEMRALDPNQPLYDVRTMAAHFQQQGLFGVRLIAEIVSAVGLVGLALSVLGLYAVIAYSVSQRTREIGIRMAIGASGPRVLGMVLQQGFTLTAIGIAIGLALTLVLSLAVGSLMNGVNPRDPLAYGAATAALLTVTLVATWLPARRAARIDPQTALRAE